MSLFRLEKTGVLLLFADFLVATLYVWVTSTSLKRQNQAHLSPSRTDFGSRLWLGAQPRWQFGQ